MADKVEVKMLRPIGGFEEGASRTMPKGDAERLQKRGVVKIVGAAKEDAASTSGEKQEPVPNNKAEGASPANKSDAPRRTKKGGK